jgi:hypothetical protein
MRVTIDEVDIPEFEGLGFKTYEWRHASAILRSDFPEQWQDLIDVLSGFRLRRSHVVKGGGEKSEITKSLEVEFKSRGWQPKNWDTTIEVTETYKGKAASASLKMESPTHEVDHVKGAIALEIEWSNKDPFYDRDLNNFRLLFDLRVISVGIIITKSEELLPLFKTLPDLDKDGAQKKDKAGNPVFCNTKFGMSTTWLGKLLPRVEGGGGGGCPVLVFAITPEHYEPNS